MRAGGIVSSWTPFAESRRLSVPRWRSASSPRLPPSPEPENRALVELLDPLFWDKELNESDLDKHRSWVIGRVLMYGTAAQVNAVRSQFGDEEIRNALQRREMDSRTRNYWMLMLEDACTRRS